MSQIDQWDLIVDGFTRREGMVDGSNHLWFKANVNSSPAHVVEFRSWKFRYADFATQISRFLPDDKHPVINLAGYSYGGYSVVKVARELDRRGIPVQCLILCDAVYRHWYAAGQWRSMVPWSKIVIPKNVREVFWFRQQHPRFALYRDQEFCGYDRFAQPAGHEVVAPGTETRLHKAVILDREHTFMDAAPEYHTRALEVFSEGRYR